MQHTYDNISGLLLLLSSLQGVQSVPLRRLGCCCTQLIEPRINITSSMTPILWAVIYHVPACLARKAVISDLSALSTISKFTYGTLSNRMKITSIDLLGLGSSLFR